MKARLIAVAVSMIGIIALTACSPNATASATAAPVAVTPISRTYMVESYELIEVSQFEDGSVKYSPTGFLVLSTPAMATATAAANR